MSLFQSTFDVTTSDYWLQTGSDSDRILHSTCGWCPILKPSWELRRSTKPHETLFRAHSCDFVDRSCSGKDNTKSN
jgi:hypothetical protein